MTLLAMFWTRISDSLDSRMNTTDCMVFVPIVGIFAHLVICRRISASWGRVVLVSLSVMKLASRRNLYDKEVLVTSVDSATNSSLDMWALRVDCRGITVWVDKSESGSSFSSVPGMSVFPLGILLGCCKGYLVSFACVGCILSSFFFGILVGVPCGQRKRSFSNTILILICPHSGHGGPGH